MEAIILFSHEIISKEDKACNETLLPQFQRCNDCMSRPVFRLRVGAMWAEYVSEYHHCLLSPRV